MLAAFLVESIFKATRKKEDLPKRVSFAIAASYLPRSGDLCCAKWCALIAVPLRAGNSLLRDEWLKLQTRAVFDFCKWDIQCEDRSVLAPFPLLLEHETASYLNRTAETLAREGFQG